MRARKLSQTWHSDEEDNNGVISRLPPMADIPNQISHVEDLACNSKVEGAILHLRKARRAFFEAKMWGRWIFTSVVENRDTS